MGVKQMVKYIPYRLKWKKWAYKTKCLVLQTNTKCDLTCNSKRIKGPDVLLNRVR